jgi:ABC-type spermidine/putrescine transport system permease subunit II
MTLKRFNIGSKSISIAGVIYLAVVLVGILAVAISAFLVSVIGFVLACFVSAYGLLSLLKMPEPLVEDRLF